MNPLASLLLLLLVSCVYLHLISAASSSNQGRGSNSSSEDEIEQVLNLNEIKRQKQSRINQANIEGTKSINIKTGKRKKPGNELMEKKRRKRVEKNDNRGQQSPPSSFSRSSSSAADFQRIRKDKGAKYEVNGAAKKESKEKKSDEMLEGERLKSTKNHRISPDLLKTQFTVAKNYMIENTKAKMKWMERVHNLKIEKKYHSVRNMELLEDGKPDFERILSLDDEPNWDIGKGHSSETEMDADGSDDFDGVDWAKTSEEEERDAAGDGQSEGSYKEEETDNKDCSSPAEGIERNNVADQVEKRSTPNYTRRSLRLKLRMGKRPIAISEPIGGGMPLGPSSSPNAAALERKRRRLIGSQSRAAEGKHNDDPKEQGQQTAINHQQEEEQKTETDAEMDKHLEVVKISSSNETGKDNSPSATLAADAPPPATTEITDRLEDPGMNFDTKDLDEYFNWLENEGRN